MLEYADPMLVVIVIVAFIVGYWLMSFIIKRMRETKENSESGYSDRGYAEDDKYSTNGGGSWNRTIESKKLDDDIHYKSVLGLGDAATLDDIRKRYRELAGQYHPDKVSHLGRKLKEVAEQEMRLINEAYDYFKRKYGIR